MGGTSVLERLATLETEVGFLRSTVTSIDAKLDKLSDLVDVRITQADTRRDVFATFGKYGALLVGGIAGLFGGTQASHLSDLMHKVSELAAH